jgi:hypothetical protein
MKMWFKSGASVTQSERFVDMAEGARFESETGQCHQAIPMHLHAHTIIDLASQNYHSV